MNSIFCIGMGPGGAEEVTRAALERAVSVSSLLGDARFLSLVAAARDERLRGGLPDPAGPSCGICSSTPQHTEELPKGTEATLHRVTELLEKGSVGVLVSGDTGFYSLASSLVRRFGTERVRLFPGISSMQLLAARRGRSWANVPTLSLHGRGLGNQEEDHLLESVSPSAKASPTANAAGQTLFALRGEAVVLLGGRERVPAQLRDLADLLGSGRRGALAWDLGLPEESITEGTLEELAAREPQGRLPLLWLDAPEAELSGEPRENALPAGVLSDSWFSRSEGIPFTKAPVRAAILGLLHPLRGRRILEIGTGTGGMTVELARAAGAEGMVLSIDPDEEALALAALHCRRAGIAVEGDARRRAMHAFSGRVHLLCGSAPEALGDIAGMDAVFVGGHGSALAEVLSGCWKSLRPGGRLAATFILLDAALTALRLLENLGGSPGLWQIAAGIGRSLAGSWMLAGQNPVFLVWGDKEAEKP